jgi:hypothetical protein
MRASLRRRTIALVTAYAIALQALLPALALVIDASRVQLHASVELCTNAVDSGGELPSLPHSGCPHGLACLMTGCSGVAAALMPQNLQLGPGFARTAIPALRPVDGTAPSVGLPHSARAPPHV